MPTLNAHVLTKYTGQIFRAYNVPDQTADVVSTSLVLSNLKGHDSHGVIRIIEYVDWLEKGLVNANATLEVIEEKNAILITDGHFGFGQLVGRQATEKAIYKCQQEGACILTLRRSGHLGRLGEFVEMAAKAGIVCFSLTNTHGGGILVAPHGGKERRLSANPLSAGAPIGEDAMIMDISTCAIAEGKIKVARERNETIAENSIIDGNGLPTTSPQDFYADPPGALLPIAEHKGFALSMFAEVLAGAISGAGCSQQGIIRVANGWFAIFIAPEAFCGQDFYQDQLQSLRTWVKSSKKRDGVDQILIPGEPEDKIFSDRSQNGIPIEDSTWQKISKIGLSQGLAIDQC